MTVCCPVRRVLFVCRGSTRDGLGHVMRSRSVAEDMARLARVQMLIIGDPYVDALLAGKGIRYQVQPDDSGFASLIRDYEPDIIVFDMLSASEAMIESARQQGMTVSLSPVFDQLHRMDLVFHRTRYPGDDWEFDSESAPELRCSLDYAVVRENCVRITEQQFADNLKQDKLAIAVSMGGADAGNKTLRMLEALSEVPRPLLIWTLLGEGYAHSYEALVECVRHSTQHEIILAKTSESMWRVLKTCTLAVLAGGTITYEAAFAGLPSINLFEDSRHVFLIHELVDRGVCISAGFPLRDAVEIAAANVSRFQENRELLLEMHRNTDGLIDGKAGQRISEEILERYWSMQARKRSADEPEPVDLPEPVDPANGNRTSLKTEWGGQGDTVDSDRVA